MIRVLLILGLAFADKLDRTYLPPPASKLSGGNPANLEVPLEQPKLQYASKDEYLKSPHVAIGIDRVGPKASLNTFQDSYSKINPSTFPDSPFVTPATYYASTKDVYSNTNPGDHNSHYLHKSQNSFNPNNQYQNYNQPRYDSVTHDNKFQTTANYPNLITGVVSQKDNSYDFLPNQIISQGESSGNVGVDISKPSLTSSHILADSKDNKYILGQNSSSPIPTIQASTNFAPSTLSPSNNHNYGSTEKPKQFYLGTPLTPHLSTSSPVKYNSPAFNSGYIEKRPERIQAQTDREAGILNYDNSITSEGYAYTFDTSNGIHGDESGIARNGVKAKGSYSYVGDDGKLYSVMYTADEYGFQPQGEHLPTAPPIPDAILKVIEQVSQEKKDGIFDDGSYDESKYGYRKYDNGFNHQKLDFSNRRQSLEKNKFIKNQKGNESENKLIEDEYSNKNNKVVLEQTSHKIPDSNFVNIGSYYPPASYQSHNNSEMEQVGTYDDADLETSDEDEKESNRPPNFFLDAVYKNSENNNERKQIDDKLKPTTNRVGQYNEFIEKQNIPKNDDSKLPYEESGYEYNPPQYKGLSQFPTRFSDTYSTKNVRAKQRNNNKVTPKPFLTPYVSHNDEIQNYETDGPFESTGSEQYEEDITQNNNNDDRDNNPIYVVDGLNGKGVYNKTEVSDYEPDESLFGKNNQFKGTIVNDFDPYTTDKGYTYEQGNLDSENTSYDSFITTSPKMYSPSTVTPFEITSRISTKQPKYPKFDDGKAQTQTRVFSPTISTATPNLYETNTRLNETGNLPYDYSSKRPGFIGQYNKNKILPEPDSYTDYLKIENVLNNTTRSEFPTIIPSFGNSYAPNIEIVHTEESTTQKNYGEDFSGPKQPQRFDPINGYYY